jgi:hypothetical protein
MNDQSWKRREGKELCPALVLGEPPVIALVIGVRRVYDDCYL